MNPDNLKIRVNPAYDPLVDPTEQEWAYVNPVALNNDLISIANEMLVLAEAQATAIKENQEYRLAKKKLARLIDRYEVKLLAKDPLAPSEAKSLKTIAAAIARRTYEGGWEEWLTKQQDKLEELEDLIDENEATIKRARLYWETGDKISGNIQTHLSFVKDERKRL
jgi:hypothetical protein